ncbi:phospholipase A1-II 1-like [Dendronephthya gigantea]|uniref:phospholipase A1-II 1-like n=1 Tax=Dendronephthya gigantea TaxID=151771 RepID=UPI00106CFEBD|nr:phospholipase A1-II 1-like [Dendronephthya gigantea]XP_028404696.1 phospholipase A1-II 1-like [Dendronephthya gigantea]
MYWQSFFGFILLFVSVTTSPLEKYIKLTIGVAKAAYLPFEGNRFFQNGHIIESPTTTQPFKKYDRNQEKYACSVGGWNAKSYASKGTEVLLFTHPQLKLAVFGFRGTEPTSLKDWSKNFKMLLVAVRFGNANFKIHQGFRDRYQDISLWFETEYQAIPADYKIMITGHSLGGALTTVSAAIVSGKTKRLPDAVIPYASPLVGGQDFQTYYQSVVGCDRTLRVTVKGDIVTKAPSTILGYRHVCSPLELEGHTGILTPGEMIENHDVYANYDRGLEQRYTNANDINLACDRLV